MHCVSLLVRVSLLFFTNCFPYTKHQRVILSNLDLHALSKFLISTGDEPNCLSRDKSWLIIKEGMEARGVCLRNSTKITDGEGVLYEDLLCLEH